VATPADLVDLKIKMRQALRIIPYDSTTAEDEKRLRWTRSSAKIFEDGFVFSKYSCTDLVILFMGLCQALNLQTRFVKGIRGFPEMHSIAEIKLPDGWYIYDLADNNYPEKGEIKPHVIYRGWYLWKKGRDSWDLDLCVYDDMYKLWQ
jgi:transglutaminase-like putative cysteine protease